MAEIIVNCDLPLLSILEELRADGWDILILGSAENDGFSISIDKKNDTGEFVQLSANKKTLSEAITSVMVSINNNWWSGEKQ